MSEPSNLLLAPPVWRSLLYVPVNVEKYVEKAHTRGADAIQLDLEDSVPEAEKAAARRLVADAARRVGRAGADVVVRINGPLRHAVRDLEAVVSPAVQAVALAKTDGPGHVRLVAETLAELERERGLAEGATRLIVMIESAAAYFRMAETAAAHPRVAGLVLSGEDFALSCGMQPEADGLYVPKVQAVIAARAAGVQPLGFIGSVADFSDLKAFRETVRRARRLGFEGAGCVHPGQVAILNEEMRPAPSEIDLARRIVEGNDAAERDGRGSFALDGRMIDVPVVVRARRLLARAAAIDAREARARAARAPS